MAALTAEDRSAAARKAAETRRLRRQQTEQVCTATTATPAPAPEETDEIRPKLYVMLDGKLPFVVTRVLDDHVEIYGGDWNPNGYNGFKAVPAGRLAPMTRAQVLRRQADR